MSFTVNRPFNLANLQASTKTAVANGNTYSTTSLTPVMAGLGAFAVATPAKSGKLILLLDTELSNNTAGNGIDLISFRYGTGTAPATGDAATGTIIAPFSAKFKSYIAATGDYAVPYTLIANVDRSGALDIAHWFDLVFEARTGGTAKINLTQQGWQAIEATN